MGGCDLGDQRLDRRAKVLLKRLAAEPQLSIPAARQGLAETTAAYRFFDNERISPDKMLQPHAEATLERLKRHQRVLLVQDTTELDFTGSGGADALGALNWAERVGLLDHSSVAFSPEGLCLGVVNAHIWTRQGPPQSHLRKHKPVETKESARWIGGYREACRIARQAEQTLVADREGDIYELFVEAQRAGADGPRAEWIVRSCYNRSLAERHPGKGYCHRKLWDAVRSAPVLGRRTCAVPKREGQPAREAILEVRAVGVELKPPFRRGRKLPPVQVQAVLASEVDCPEGQEPLQWVLLSSLPAAGLEQACQIIDHYLVRWQIESYFRVLKSACRVESLQFRTVERLKRCIVLKKIAAWRTLFVTHLSRVYPQAPCTVAFADAEWKSVHTISEGGSLPAWPPSLSRFVAMVASLGGYLGRKADGPPGALRLCIGLQIMHHYATAWLAFGPERPRDV